VTDGAAAGTHELTGIAGTYGSGLYPSDLTVYNGEVLFAGLDASGHYGVWVTNGTAAGTYELTGIAGANASGISPGGFTLYDGEVLFDGLGANGDYGLWVTNGTAAGTHELTGVAETASDWVEPNDGMVVYDGEVLFAGIDVSGDEGLWVTNGTAAGTHELTGIAGADPSGLGPSDLTVFDGEVLFAGVDASGDEGLWVTNGTAAGTQELTPIAGADASGLDPSDLTVYDGEVLFAGVDASGNYGLWVTNGTAAGTHELTTVAGYPSDLTIYNGEVLFAGQGGLWVTNGTAAGTHELAAGWGPPYGMVWLTPPVPTSGNTTLAQVGDLFELNPAGGATGPLLQVNGDLITAGQFAAGWTPVGAVETGNGYEVAWSIPGANEYEVWDTDGNGDYTSATGILTPTNSAPTLAALEANFGDDFAGLTPASTTTIASNGATTLAEVGNLFELNPAGGGTGPLLELNGDLVAAGQFAAGWTPVGAVETGNGYEVAWSVPGANEYEVWDTDSSGDYTSAATGILTPANSASTLEGLEANFGEDFAGLTPASAATIASNGATTLAEVGNLFELNPAGGGTGPLLQVDGELISAGQFAAGWTPVGAVEIGDGYEVAWSVPGANEYEVWNTDSNGDYTSAATAILTPTNSASTLEGLEANFGEDFAGLTPASATTIASNGATTLAEVGNLFELNPAGGGTGPLLQLDGDLVTAGQFAAGWTPVGAVETGNGYELAWSVPGANEYVIWNTDSNGNYTSAATGILSGASPELEAAETYFGENFPGVTSSGSGPPASTTTIASNGTTTLAEVGNLFELNPAGGGTGPVLQLNGDLVTAGQFAAGWTPVGAVETGDGYEVAWSVPGANEYEVWNTDSNGDYTSAATATLSGANPELEAVEAYFGEDFAGTSASAPPNTPASTTGTQGGATGAGAGADKVSAASPLEAGPTDSNDRTIDFSGGASAVDLIDPKGFSGKIENFASPDRLDLSGDWNYLHFSENSRGALGTLILQNVKSHADLSLRFVGDYSASDFAVTPGITTTTIAHT
jgi:ELWxxDGT repeat protein